MAELRYAEVVYGRRVGGVANRLPELVRRSAQPPAVDVSGPSKVHSWEEAQQDQLSFVPVLEQKANLERHRWRKRRGQRANSRPGERDRTTCRQPSGAGSGDLVR